MTKEDFYGACAALLGVGRRYVERSPPTRFAPRSLTPYRPPTRASRWGDRQPGNGRFPGFGLARMFAADHVQLVLTRPISINRTFDSPEAAVAFLRATLRVQQETEPPGTGRIAE
jgi:hypothetical protein